MRNVPAARISGCIHSIMGLLSSPTMYSAPDPARELQTLTGERPGHELALRADGSPIQGAAHHAQPVVQREAQRNLRHQADHVSTVPSVQRLRAVCQITYVVSSCKAEP